MTLQIGVREEKGTNSARLTDNIRNGLKLFELYWDSKQPDNKKMEGVHNDKISMGTYSYRIERKLSRVAEAMLKLP